MRNHLFFIVLATCLVNFPTLAIANEIEAAEKLLAMGRYHEALPIIKKAIQAAPDDPMCYPTLAKIQFHLSHFSETREALNKAIKLGGEPAKRWAAHLFARLEFWAANDEEARAQLTISDPEHFVYKQLPFLLDASAKMQKKRTSHYLVHIDEALAKKGSLEPLAKNMEKVHDVYSKIFRFKSEPIVNRVYVFGEESGFRNFLSKIIADVPANAAHYYSRNYRIIVLNADPRVARPLSNGLTDSAIYDSYVEGFSQFADMYCPGLPEWFQDGVSSYVGDSEFDDGEPKIGTFRRKNEGSPLKTKYERLKESLRDGSCLPLTTLLTMSEKEFIDGASVQEHVNRAQAWSFVHFLLHSKKYPNGRKLLSALFLEMRDGKSKEEAFAKTIGAQDLSKVEQLWRDYVNQL